MGTSPRASPRLYQMEMDLKYHNTPSAVASSGHTPNHRLHGNEQDASAQKPPAAHMPKDKESSMNIRPDMVFVIGIQDAVTDLAERFCAEVGLSVRYAMKKSDPSQRIDSIDEEAVIVPPLPEENTVLFCGLRASDRLLDDEGGRLDCNWSGNDGSAFAVPLMSFLHVAAKSQLRVPNDWKPAAHDLAWQYRNSSVGQLGPAGTVVADFGHGCELWQLPEAYSLVFPLIENKRW